MLALIAALGLTGCGKTVVLNEQQTAETAEYIAGLMLKYSKNYTDSLQYPEETPEPTGSPDVTTAPGITAEPENQNPSATSEENGNQEQEYTRRSS